jgi:tetratricopeptide (TPR) repeat protein
MKQKLPQSATKVIALFPSNIRSITEVSLTSSQSRNIKIGLVSFFSLFLIGLIFLQGVTLWYNIQQREVYLQERAHLEKEIVYWQQVADKYQGYRDVYYRIATLQYKLGNVAASQEYIKKALELDPNFPEGRVLGTKVGL